MRILYVCAVDLARQFAGTVHVLETVENLRSLGHKVVLIATSHGGGPGTASRRTCRTQDTFFMPIPPVPVLKAILFHVLLSVYVCILVIRYRIEIIYEREIPFGLGVILPAMAFGIPRVVEINGLPGDEENVPEPRKLRDRARSAFQRIDLRMAAAVVAVCRQMRDVLISRHSLHHVPCFVVPNGVNEKLFHPKDTSACRRELGLREDIQYVCCVSSFYKYHGIDILIQAAQVVVEKRPQTVFLLIGDGLERVCCEQMAAASGSAQHFVFTGMKPNTMIPLYLCAADVCVFIYKPTYERPVSPLKLVEYLACGRPTLVATTAKSLFETYISENGQYPFVMIEDAHPNSVGQALLQMLNSPAAYAEMGKRAREFVLRHHTWSRTAKDIESILLGLRAER